MRVGERVCQLAGDVEGIHRWERTSLAQHLVERLAVDRRFHHPTLLPLPGEPQDLHDVLVPQLAGLLDSPLETREELGVAGDLL